MSFFPELDGMELDRLKLLLTGQGPEPQPSFKEEVAFAILKHGSDGAAFLLEQFGEA